MRPKGAKNKATLLREAMVQAALESAIGVTSTKLPQGKEALGRVLQYFEERATQAAAEFLKMRRPEPANAKDDKRYKRALDRYREAERSAINYMKLTAETADRLIGYQTPKLSHTTMVQADPFESMSDEELRADLIRRSRELGLPEPKLAGLGPSKMN